MLHVNDKLEGVICIHVDDFIYGGNREFLAKVIDPLRQAFIIGSESTNAFKYLGLNLIQEENQILIDQNVYIETIKNIDINPDRKRYKNEPLTETELAEYRTLVGQLGWVAHQTRPDLSFDLCDLSSRFNCATINDIFQANKVLMKAKTNSVTLKIGINDLENSHIVGYNDASFGNLPDGGSQGGYIIFLKSRMILIHPFHGSQRKYVELSRVPWQLKL